MDSDDESESDEDSVPRKTTKLITSLEDEGKKVNGLSKRAALFFDQDIFQDIAGDEGEDDDGEDEDGAEEDYEDEEEEAGEDIKGGSGITTNGVEEEEASDIDSDWEGDVRNLKKQPLSDYGDGGFEVVPTEEGVDDTRQPGNLGKPLIMEYYCLMLTELR